MISTFKIQTQPDCISCGPACLQALYNHFNDDFTLENTINKITYLNSGGTLAVFLANHALERGYQAILHSYNFYVLDPSWFKGKNINLTEKISQQLELNLDAKIKEVTQGYLQFLNLGGRIIFQDLTFKTIQDYLNQNLPILSGINATYFYQNMRDYTNQDNRAIYDEFLGAPSGHFLIIYDYDRQQNLQIADPFSPHPLSRSHYYQVSYNHWLHALLLGISSFDAELLIIYKN